MLPNELKTDKNGLLYMNDGKVLKCDSLLLDRRDTNNKYFQNGFYPINGTKDYIVKYSYTPFMKSEREKIMKMLEHLVSKQKQVSSVDFPIGYFRRWLRLHGLVVRYYQDSLSLDNIIENNDVSALKRYYYHDEDDIHNLFLLLNDVLDIIYEMFENEIYYTDINPGNIVLTDNQVKIIDFDYRLVHFDNKDKRLEVIMYVYDMLFRCVLEKYNLNYGNLYEIFKDFEDVKKITKKIENNIRKGY